MKWSGVGVLWNKVSEYLLIKPLQPNLYITMSQFIHFVCLILILWIHDLCKTQTITIHFTLPFKPYPFYFWSSFYHGKTGGADITMQELYMNNSLLIDTWLLNFSLNHT